MHFWFTSYFYHQDKQKLGKMFEKLVTKNFLISYDEIKTSEETDGIVSTVVF